MTPASVPSSVQAFGDADYQFFQQKVHSKCGIRLSDYKSEQMRRRITAMSQQAGCQSFVHYFTAMERDAAVLSGFLDRMTINVTELLRNPERFTDLAKVVLPDLMARKKSAPLSAWSAGCSYGAEAYTLAMLFHEISPGVAHRVKGTDIDLAVLSKANCACFTEADMVNISAERRRIFFNDLGTGAYLPAASLRSRVQFGRHDLLADAYPSSEYDLILCRNVLIYFTEPAKERIYQGFFRALRPGGVLFVGGTERLSDHRAIGFDLLLPFFYRKPG